MSSSLQSPASPIAPFRRVASLIRGFFFGETTLYILKRLFQAALTLLLASALSFLVVQLAPGDFLTPFRQSTEMSPETLAQLSADFGLDKPLWVQYLSWLRQAVTRFDFGISFAYQRPALELLWERVPNTLLLSAASILVTWAIAIPLGIVSAVNYNRWPDRFLRLFSYIGQGFPTLITGILLLFFRAARCPTVSGRWAH